jgi:glycosyltransferase involved in cell wall biosynthesis
VILQRPEELHGLAERWLGGRRPGRDVPAVYVEHNAPQGRINELRHPAADRDDLTVAHVTHFNALLWDTGRTRATVIEHGVVDPGERWTGELPRVAAAVNEPGRRGRVTGTDLLPAFADAAPLDLFGMGAAALAEELGHPALAGHENPPQHRLHAELARRRAYLHPIRWTSLGLSLIEAMHLGMPVVALATTEAPEAVPPGAGIVSNRMDHLTGALRRLVADPDEGRMLGKAAREAALARFGLGRFLDDWDRLLGEVTG